MNNFYKEIIWIISPFIHLWLPDYFCSSSNRSRYSSSTTSTAKTRLPIAKVDGPSKGRSRSQFARCLPFVLKLSIQSELFLPFSCLCERVETRERRRLKDGGLCNVGWTHPRSLSLLCRSRSCSIRLFTSLRERVCLVAVGVELRDSEEVVGFDRESREARMSSIF